MANYTNNLGQIRLGWRTAPTVAVSGTDSDATLFITAAGITDSTQISAINTLVADLKAYGLWTKMKAIYPFVGGSATSHKWNLKDPRDLDAAYRLVFNGGWVHSSNGALPNGTTGYANTYYNPSSLLNPFIGYYSRSNTNTNTDQIDMGCSDGNKWFWISSWYKTTFYNNILARNSSSSILLDGGIQSDSRGWYWTNKISNVAKLGKNSNVLTTANDTTNPANASIGIGAMGSSNTSANYFSNRETAFSVIADGLSDTETSNLYISVQKFQTTLGRHVGTPYVSDPDAIAFLMTAGITDGTQASAINTLVIRMKADGVWTKMKAIYPFVGGSAASHKFNLKDPRDLDAAFRLAFNGGWTHTGTGAKPNGTTGYANTYLNPYVVFGNNQGLFPANSTHQLIHVSKYSRTNSITTVGKSEGVYSHSGNQARFMFYAWDTVNVPNGVAYLNGWGYYKTYSSVTLGNRSDGFFVINRDGYTSLKSFRNNTLISTNNTDIRDYNEVGLQLNLNANQFFFIGARNDAYDLNLRPYAYNDFETSFQSIGWSLTDTEASNFYSAVQAFQTTLGRQTDVPLVSDTDAQAFLNAANITSFQQASAVNKLVVDLKAAGVWTKMKAIYPFVGGSAASHKFNLKDPRDLDAAYRLVFNGGWTHTSTGAQPNGTTGYADTKLNESSVMTLGSQHISFYSRTNVQGLYLDMGIWGNTPAPGYPAGYGSQLLLRYTWPSTTDSFIGYSTDGDNNYISNNDSRGFFMSNRTSNSQLKLQKNSTINTFTSNVISKTNLNFYIGARNIYNSTSYLYSPRESAFATIGDGLTDAEATSLYNAVQTYQTSLGRAVDTPVYNNGLVLNLDAGNANSYPGTGTTWFDLASGNNGTLVNGPTYDFNNGGSLYFDGTNKYTDISYTKINITNKLTINAWVYFLSQPSTSGNPNIVDKWDWPNNKRSFSLGTENGYLSTSISYDGLFDNRIVCSDNSSIILNQWINITMTYDGRTLKLYKNGSLIQSSSFSQDRNIFSDITTNIFLGRSRGSEGISRHVNARISGVQIYSNSLTSTEILNNFNSTRGRFGL